MFSDLLAFGNFRRKYSPDWHNLKVQASHFQWQKTWFWKQIHLTMDAFLIFWKGNLDFLDRTFWLIGFPNVNVSWPSFFWSDFYIISQKRKENSSYWQGSVRVRHRASCPPSPGLCPTHTPCPSSTLGALKLRNQSPLVKETLSVFIYRERGIHDMGDIHDHNAPDLVEKVHLVLHLLWVL